MMPNTDERWWRGNPRERFWLESTNRDDVGVDLRAPLANAGGRPDWRYGLFREVDEGDVVLHYDTRQKAITSFSRIAGREAERPIVWAAHGTYARERGAAPEELPGYYVPLADHQQLSVPLTLDALRAAKPTLTAIVDRLTLSYRKPLYFPFELSDRPVRPNQGYAFKLPAAFMEAFPELAMAMPWDVTADVAVMSAPSASASASDTLVRRMANVINEAADGYAVGDLQQLRKNIRGLRRVPRRQIFSARSVADDWAFHSGGRDELQFNIGMDEWPDGSAAFRAGLAFSLEPSQSLPDWRVLVPIIARFNDYMREHAEQFGDLNMWHWQGRERSSDWAPGPIRPELARQGSFIFIGALANLDAADASWCLSIFDRLLPLYVAVQSASNGDVDQVSVVQIPRLEILRLEGGVSAKTTGWTTATLPERTLNTFLRHNEMQNRLKARLDADHTGQATLEARIGLRAIDLVHQADDRLTYYEVKTAGTVRQCIREAVGQLLEYALWPGATCPARLVVVGEPAPTPESEAYLETLNAAFPVRIEYEQLVLD